MTRSRMPVSLHDSSIEPCLSYHQSNPLPEIMGRKKISTDEIRVQVPLKRPVYAKLEAEAGEMPVGRTAAGIIAGHFGKTGKRKGK